MNEQIYFKVNPKEKVYFSIMAIISAIFYIGILVFMAFSARFGGFPVVIIFAVYAIIIAAFILFRNGILVGYIKGNSVKVGEKQFAEVREIVVRQSKQLGLDKVPDLYIIESGGLLNAFAIRLLGKDYVVLYSDVVDEALESGLHTVEFIVAHELGHIKRKHAQKQMWCFPSLFFPLLAPAYSRACEYTCDNVGAQFSTQGAINGLVMLAAGKRLYRNVNVDRFILQKSEDGGFWVWAAEKFSTHPHLTKRVTAMRKILKSVLEEHAQAQTTVKVPTQQSYSAPVQNEIQTEPVVKKEAKVKSSGDDHSRFMPQL